VTITTDSAARSANPGAEAGARAKGDPVTSPVRPEDVLAASKPNFLKRREAERAEQIEDVGAKLRRLMSWLTPEALTVSITASEL
jgi:hypothetical protein